MKKLIVLASLLTSNFAMAQMLPPLTIPADANSKVLIKCTSRGAGVVPLQITFLSENDLNNLTTGVITASGQNFYRFPIKILDLQKHDDQLSFNFVGQDIEGSYEVNLKDGKPLEEGNIDLTKRPILGAAVFNKYVLSGCNGKLQ